MNPDPANLDNLRDLAEPPMVSWWPLAPGWWGGLVLVLLASAYFSFRFWRSWRARAYRRAALAELVFGADLATVAGLLKRTALVAYPRSEVAGLTGTVWCEWLEKTGGERMPDQVREALSGGVFGVDSAASSPEVTAFTSAWISNHRCHGREGQGAC
jgi:hypothetical protein